MSRSAWSQHKSEWESRVCYLSWWLLGDHPNTGWKRLFKFKCWINLSLFLFTESFCLRHRWRLTICTQSALGLPLERWNMNMQLFCPRSLILFRMKGPQPSKKVIYRRCPSNPLVYSGLLDLLICQISSDLSSLLPTFLHTHLLCWTSNQMGTLTVRHNTVALSDEETHVH